MGARDHAERSGVPQELAEQLESADWVVGVDEVGYGAWAGPLVIGRVAVPRGWVPKVRIGDSKALTPKQRETANTGLMDDNRILHSLHMMDAGVIDNMGVGPALRKLHEEAVYAAKASLQHLYPGKNLRILAITDGSLKMEGAYNLPKADALIPAVSAASILAKVFRDRLMTKLDTTYPGYDFAQSKGYGVPKHQAGLNKLGPCLAHRKSYSPIANLIALIEAQKGKLLMDSLGDEPTEDSHG